MSMKVNVRSLIIFLIFAIYPIIPQYFGLGGVSVLKMMCLGISVCYIWISRAKLVMYKNAKGVLAIMGVWCVLLLCSSIINGDVIEFVYEMLCYYCILLVGMNCVNTRSRYLWAIDLLIAGAVIAGIIGIIESFTNFNLFQILNTMGTDLTSKQPLRLGLHRIVSFTYQTISYASYCMFALALVFYRLTLCKSKADKTKYYVFYAIIAISEILTLSRSMLLITLMCKCVLLYVCGYKVFLKRSVIVLAAVFVVTLILSFLPKTQEAIQSFVYMLLAVFDDRYAQILGDIDGTGVGDRMDLFAWVWSEVKDKMWLGMGGSTNFSYSYLTNNGIYDYTRTKTSIENQYLKLLFHYGILGLLANVAIYIGLLCACVKKWKFVLAAWESKLSINKVAFVTCLCYFISFFAVQQMEEKRMMFCFIILIFCYNINGRFDDNVKAKV